MNEDYMFEDETIHEEKTDIPHYPQPKPGIGMAVASFILGIISLVFFISFINVFSAITAVILAIIFLVNQKERQGRVFAIFGIITAVASVICLIVSLFAVSLNINHVIPLYNDFITTYGLEDEYNYIEMEDGVYYIPEELEQQ